MDPFLLVALAEGCGPAVVPALLDPDRSPAELLRDPPEDLTPAARRRLRDRSLHSRAQDVIDRCRELEVQILTPSSPAYPESMRTVPGRPAALFVRGSVEALAATRAVAVVGSRTPTPYGLAATQDYTAALARAGAAIWSGLAFGIDAAAHETSLSHDAVTVAVLAGGLDSLYPTAHRGLADRIAASGGALVSEAPPGLRPRRGHFPRRNRILAAASGAVLVIEAGLASGSLQTARAAAEFGRAVLAVPGPYTSSRSRGCHRLLEEGAMPASDPPELLRALAIDWTDAHSAPCGADEIAILEALESGPRPADLIRRETGLSDAAFTDCMLRLLERGSIARAAGDVLARQSAGAPQGRNSI